MPPKAIPRPQSPRRSETGAVGPAAPKSVGESKKIKAKKPKATAAAAATISLGVPLADVDGMSEAEAKRELLSMQQKYGALLVNFNNQQVELAAAKKSVDTLKAEVKSLKSQMKSPEGQLAVVQGELENTLQELRAAEGLNMQLQKKINKLQVEHVSEEEVDQLFYALELKEQQLAQAKQQNEGLQQEVLTARQMSARGGNAEPRFIEIHHHSNLSDDSDDDSDEAS